MSGSRDGRVRCEISPDADDRFMFRAIELGLIDTHGLDFEIRTADTHRLNQLAQGLGADLAEVNAISVAWYPHLAQRWQLLPHGGSVGRGYGPVLVAPTPGTAAELAGHRVAVPGTTTTAWTVLSMVVSVEPVVVPIVPMEATFHAIERGEVDAALLIHEGRLTYRARGLHERLDLGRWWSDATGGLPLPLGANVIRRDLGPERIRRISAVIRASIAHGLSHREEAIDWLLAGGTALPDAAAVDHYLSLYANADTLDYGEDGRAGIAELLRRGAAAGTLPECPPVDLAP